MAHPKFTHNQNCEKNQKFAQNLYDPNGGIIDQFEFGLDVNPETAIAVLEEWEKVNKR